MSLQVGEEIGEEVHEDRDQFFRLESGSGAVVIDGIRHAVEDDDAIVVPAAPPQRCQYRRRTAQVLHALRAVRAPRRRRPCDQADASEEHFDGVTTIALAEVDLLSRWRSSAS